MTRRESGDQQPSQVKKTLTSSGACSVMGRGHHEGEPGGVTLNVAGGPGNGATDEEDKQ